MRFVLHFDIMTVRSFDIILIRDNSRKWHLQQMDLTQSHFESQIFRWNNQNTNLFPLLLFSVAFDFVFQIRSRVENAFGSTCHLDFQTSQTKNKQIISSLLTVQPITNWLWDHNQLLFQFKIQKKKFQLSFFLFEVLSKGFLGFRYIPVIWSSTKEIWNHSVVKFSAINSTKYFYKYKFIKICL